jgi:hypothetical protein
MITITFFGGPLDGTDRQVAVGPGDEITVDVLVPDPAGGAGKRQVGIYRRQRPGLAYVWDALTEKVTTP